MGLLQNISMLSAEPICNRGGAAVQCIIRSSYNRPEQNMNKYFGEAWIDKKCAVPNGYSPPYQWAMAIKSGGMASYYSVFGSGAVVSDLGYNGLIAASIAQCLGYISTANMVGGANVVADLSGAGTAETSPLNIMAWSLVDLAGAGGITAAELLAPFLVFADVDGSGDVTEAGLVGIASLLAGMVGDGEVTNPNMNAIAQMVSALSGDGSVEGILTGISWLVASILAAGDAEGAVYSKMYMDADITSSGDLVTAQTCAAAVWSALAAAYNDSGTMGEMLNASGAGGDPWIGVIESGITAKEVLRLLMAVMAGKSSGGGTSTISFRDSNDGKDRVVATVDANGNRTDVAVDLS